MIISKGKKKKPVILLIHGEPDSGKTHFATTMPNPLFIATEMLNEIDAAKIEKIDNWDFFLDAMKYAITNAKKEDYETVVIDTLDGVEMLLHRSILAKEKTHVNIHQAMGGYGRATDHALSEFVYIRDRFLNVLWEQGINIALIAHSEAENNDDIVNQIEYKRMVPLLEKKTSRFFTGWAHAVVYLEKEIDIERKREKNYIVNKINNRILHISSSATVMAKNRFNIKKNIRLGKGEGFPKLNSLINNFYNDSGNLDLSEFNELLDKVKDKKLTEKVLKRVNETKNYKEAVAFLRNHVEKEISHGK